MTVDDKLMLKSMLESMQYELSNQLGSEYCRKKYEVITKAIKELEQKPSEDIMSIHTQGLDEGIRCAMCTNSMKSNRGCDGGCVVNEGMYKEVMNTIKKQIVPSVTPMRKKGKWIEIKNKNGTVIALRCDCCKESPKHAIKSLFCPNCGAYMRGEEYGSN